MHIPLCLNCLNCRFCGSLLNLLIRTKLKIATFWIDAPTPVSFNYQVCNLDRLTRRRYRIFRLYFYQWRCQNSLLLRGLLGRNSRNGNIGKKTHGAWGALPKMWLPRPRNENNESSAEVCRSATRTQINLIQPLCNPSTRISNTFVAPGVPSLGLTMPYTLRAWQSNWNQLKPGPLAKPLPCSRISIWKGFSSQNTRQVCLYLRPSTKSHLGYIDKNISRSRGEWESGVCRIAGPLLGSVRRILSQTCHRPVTNHFGFFVSIVSQASFQVRKKKNAFRWLTNPPSSLFPKTKEVYHSLTFIEQKTKNKTLHVYKTTIRIFLKRYRQGKECARMNLNNQQDDAWSPNEVSHLLTNKK